MLGLADEEGQNVRAWLPALFADGQLYLFDCRLGLPIAGPTANKPATLAEVVADEALLARLDLDDAHRYGVRGEDLKHVVASVEASPEALSRRMALVESRLSGAHKLTLSSPGSALVARLRQVAHVSDAGLWLVPFEVWRWQARLSEEEAKAAARDMYVFQAVPSLLTGRSLYFKGTLDGEKGAKVNLLQARPSQTMIDNWTLPKDLAQKVKEEARSKVEAMQMVVMQQAKQDSTLWLGLIAYEQKDYKTAAEFLDRFTLQATPKPKGRWAQGARYNLARVYEAQGNLPGAIELYESDAQSPQSDGNRLRARQLKEQVATAKAASDAGSSDRPAP
jgi:tetratricopeptide (TPR) repeat protein